MKIQKRKQHGRDSRRQKRAEQARTAQQQIREHLKGEQP